MENSSTTLNNRLVWIDWLKFIGIALVVWAHISPIFQKEIFLFHMPLFFMISGALYKQKGIKKELLNSSQSLLLPYLIYNLLYMMPLPLGGERSWHSVINILLGNQEQLCYVMVPLWFVVALFVMRAICSIKKINLYIFGIIGLLLSVILFGIIQVDQTNDYFQLKTVIFCMPFFAMGGATFRLCNYTNSKNKYLVLSLSLVCMAAVFAIGMCNAPDKLYNVYHCRYGTNIFFYYFASSIVCLSLFVLVSRFLTNVRCLYVETISKGTLLILCLHMPIYWKIPHLFDNEMLTAILNMIIIILVTYVLIRLSEKYLPIMIGKRLK